MRKLSSLAIAFGLLFMSQPMQAWFDGGHMLVAYIAYKNLKPNTQKRVDKLIKKNPLYSTWTKGVASKQKGLTAFVMAATWADCIKSAKCTPGYTSDGGNNPPGNPTDDQNIGYADKFQHRYLHFVDIPDEAGAPGKAPAIPNALTRIQLLASAIGTKESDDIKSYDIVWLEHLIGDVHQPLHSTSRFTVNHPNGDAGGNFLVFCAKPCTDELHAFWDGLLGDKPPVSQTIVDGDQIIALGPPSGFDNLAPTQWVQDSFELAKGKAYVAPISDDNDPMVLISPRPDAAYSTQATAVARAQAALAGFRLAGILNAHLK